MDSKNNIFYTRFLIWETFKSNNQKSLFLDWNSSIGYLCWAQVFISNSTGADQRVIMVVVILVM